MKTPYPKDQIKKLHELASDAANAASKYRAEARAAEVAWAREEFDVKEGDIVEYMGCKFQVVSFGSIHGIHWMPSLNCRKIKKDGTPSLNVRYIGGEWKKVSE